MTELNVHSHNLRGSLKSSIDHIVSLMDDSECECTAICLQDVGLTGPDGPPLLRKRLGDHSLFVNSKSSNKSRTVALIIHKSWQIKSIYRDPTGSLIGVVASNTDVDILFVSVCVWVFPRSGMLKPVMQHRKKHTLSMHRLIRIHSGSSVVTSMKLVL